LGLSFGAKAAGIIPQVEQLAPASLAYIGDAVYELYMRGRYLLPPKKIKDFHDKVVARVRAEAQASDLQKLEIYLSDAEKDLLRRGRNAAGTTPKRLSPQIYQQATALETLLGYLYLTDGDRLQELLEKLD
jgi:ribonuclease III family protein